MFYTKYRPQKFSEISRPNDAADALVNQVLNEKTVHAYLFVGPRGTGKTSTARILAKALNCEKIDKKGDPCCKCDSCEAIKNGNYLDLIEIDAASNRGIDDIRELKNKIKLAPSVGTNKVYIVDEVHMLTTEAFNALLKTLEEPPRNTTFILCTTELHKVPDTIKSRCQVFKFKRATSSQLVTKLENIAKAEKIKITKEDLEKIARASVGGFRDAETLLQQLSDGAISVDSFLNSGSNDSYIEFFNSLFNKDAGASLTIVNKAAYDGIDIYVWLGEAIKHLRDILLLKSGMSIENIDVSEEILEDIKKQSSQLTLTWVTFVIDKLLTAHYKIKGSFISQLPLEIAIVEICNFENNAPSNTSASPAKPLPQNPTPSNLASKIKSSLISTKETATLEKVEIPIVEAVTQPIKSDKKIIEDSVENDNFSNETENVNIGLEIEAILEKWQEVVQKVDQINKSIVSLLRVGKPSRIDGRFLVIEVFYAFHKERLESTKNRIVVEQVLKEIYSYDLAVRCEINGEKPEHLKAREVGVLTDINVVPIDKSAVLGMLDGGLPL